MSTVDEIYHAIQSLPPPDRSELLERLIALEEQSPFAFDAEWREELARRSAALRNGKMGTKSWEEVRDAVRAKYPTNG